MPVQRVAFAATPRRQPGDGERSERRVATDDPKPTAADLSARIHGRKPEAEDEEEDEP